MRSLLLLTFGILAFSLFGQSTLYWTNTGNFSLYRGLTDGTGLEQVSTGFSHGLALVGDLQDSVVFSSALNNIQRTNIDGSDREFIVSGLGPVYGMDVDMVNKKLYFADVTEHIYRCNYDGSEQEIVVETEGPETVALDLENNHVYWSQWRDGMVGIFRYNLDNAQRDTLISEDVVRPWTLRLDLLNGKMYWSDSSRDEISSADLDGQNRELLLSGLGGVSDLVVDELAGDLYWTNTQNFTSFIQKTALADLSQIDTLFTDDDGLSFPESLLFVPETVDTSVDPGGEDVMPDVRISPNPATHSLHVSSGVPLVSISVFSADGRLLFSEAGRGLPLTVDVRHLAPGVYFLRAESSERLSAPRKFVVGPGN